MTSLVNYLASSGYRIAAVLCGCMGSLWIIERIM